MSASASDVVEEGRTRIDVPVDARPDYTTTPGEQGQWGYGWGGKNQLSNPDNEDLADLMERSAWVAETYSMLRDPKLNRAVSLNTNNMLAADIVCEPPKGSGEGSQEVAAFLEEALGLEQRAGMMCRPWREIMREAIHAYYTGCTIGEEVYYAKDGNTWLKDIEPRPMAKMVGWGRDTAGRVFEATFRRTDGSSYTLPLNDLNKGCLHVAPSYSADPEGRDACLLRACHFWVQLKRHAGRQVWQGFDQWGSSVPMVSINHGLAAQLDLTPQSVQKIINEAKASVKRFYAGGRGAALVGGDIVSFERYGGGLDVSAPVAIMNLIDEQITTAVGAGQIVMGISSSHGSRSAGEVHTDLGKVASGGMLDHFCGRVRHGPATRLVRFNFGPRAPVPLIEHRGLDVDGIAAHLGTLPHLVVAGLLDVPETREKIRRTLGLRMVERIRDEAASAPDPASMPTLGNPGEPGPGRGNFDAAAIHNAVTVLRAALAPALGAIAA